MISSGGLARVCERSEDIRRASDARTEGQKKSGQSDDRKRTVSLGGGLVVEVVAQDSDGLVKQAGGVGLRAALEDLGEQVGVVAAAGLDQLLLRGGALYCVS